MDQVDCCTLLPILTVVLLMNKIRIYRESLDLVIPGYIVSQDSDSLVWPSRLVPGYVVSQDSDSLVWPSRLVPGYVVSQDSDSLVWPSRLVPGSICEDNQEYQVVSACTTIYTNSCFLLFQFCSQAQTILQAKTCILNSVFMFSAAFHCFSPEVDLYLVTTGYITLGTTYMLSA